MSQNDFTIANLSFPAFRADLNSALQALASNNSGGSAPSTTFANMWWYDSSNNIMYIRNEDNDAWIKFAELDQANDKFVLSGTLQLDDGTVSAPALTFNSDTNMGIYRGGTDILKFVTAGTDAITINASQNTTFGSGSDTTLSIDSSSAFDASLTTDGTGQALNIIGTNNSSNGNVYIKTGGTGTPLTRARFEPDGDISFYEDTGTTPKLFWDASAERLGIGTTSGTGRLSLDGTGTGATTVLKVNNTDSASFVHAQQNIAPNLASSNTVVNFVGKELSAKNSGYIGYTWVGAGSNSNRLTFGHYASDYLMNLTADGNLLVGKTSSTSSTVGCELDATGRAMFTRASGISLLLNRTSSEGTLAEFRYNNNVTAGIAITNGGNILSINGLGSGLGFHKSANTNIVYPFKNNVTSDNIIDLGSSGVRFDDVYATNGTIQTSDQNEKNTITDSDLGIDFIKRLSPKSYIFNGKTRTHYGLIAQDVETVLTDIGKTGIDFAGFIKSDISEAEDGSEYRYGLRYTEFVAPLIKAVKDQQAIIEDLQARIVALENA